MKITENRGSGASGAQFSKDYDMEQLREKLQTVMDFSDASFEQQQNFINGT